MGIHHEIYSHLVALVPDLQSLGKRKDPYLLRAEGRLPVNVYVSSRTGDKVVLILGSYPFDGHGHIVPDPEVEIEIDTLRGEAFPLRYAGTCRRVERGGMPEGEKGRLDRAVRSWLTGLGRSGFRFVGPWEPDGLPSENKPWEGQEPFPGL